MKNEISVERQPDGSVIAVVNDGGFVMRWWLREGDDGSNDWRASKFMVETVQGRSELTAADVRALPVASSLRAASAKARTTNRLSAPFASVTDPPAVWRQDGRGRGGARTDRDYAELAFAYVSAADPKSRRTLPRRWSEGFGGAVKTWQNRLAETRSRLLLDNDDRLTEKAEQLLFGGALDIEQTLMEAERRLSGDWRPGERARYIANDRRIEDVLAADQQLVDDYYS